MFKAHWHDPATQNARQIDSQSDDLVPEASEELDLEQDEVSESPQ